MHDQLHEYIGAVHIHSTYSDGSDTIPEIAGIAGEVGLDFLMFSDHHTLQPKRDHLEGWYNGVLVAIGYEINDAADENHYLAFNLDEEIPRGYAPLEYVQAVSDRGGQGIIAHPDEKHRPMKQYPPCPWKVWESNCYNGIEIWNQMSEWMEGLNHFNKYWRAFNPRRTVLSPSPETLRKWDEANRLRRVVGIGGVDAHGHIYRLWGFFQVTIFRYKVLLKTIRTHIVTERALAGEGGAYQPDIQNLYSNMFACHCFVSNYYIGDARGFRFWAENDHNKVIVGDELKFDKYTHLHVNLPLPAQIHLIRDGKKIAVQKGQQLVFEASGPGLYRVEVYSFNRPWIFSNHIRIK
jgi:hypothetical protein